MKSFFLFSTSADYPQEARTIQFSTLREAKAELQSRVSRAILFFDRYCFVRPNKHHTAYTIIDRNDHTSIQISITRCDVHDPIQLYPRY